MRLLVDVCFVCACGFPSFYVPTHVNLEDNVRDKYALFLVTHPRTSRHPSFPGSQDHALALGICSPMISRRLT